MDAALMLAGLALGGIIQDNKRRRRRGNRRPPRVSEPSADPRAGMPSFTVPLPLRPAGMHHAPRKQPSNQSRLHGIDERPDKTLKELRAQAAQVQRQHYLDAADPMQSGIFDPLSGPMLVSLPRERAGSMMPLERSSRLNTVMKQRKLETFTGNIEGGTTKTGVWRHKRETKPRFSPLENRGRVTSGGTAGNKAGPSMRRDRMPVAAQTQNNVLPAPKVIVGRGVNVGPDTPAADGFHPRYRRLPGSGALGTYKKNQLPGGFNIGKAPVDRRQAQTYGVQSYHAPRFYDMARRPMAATMARVTAPTSHATEPREVCGGAKVMSEEYFGHRALVNGVDGPGVGVDISHATREGFTERSIDGAPPVLGVSTTVPAPQAGLEDTYYDEGRFEKLHSYGGGPDHVGPPETLIKSGYVDKSDQAPQPTLRERPSWLSYVGIAAPTHVTGALRQQANKQLDRHATRGDQLVLDYQSNPLLKRPDILTYGEFAYQKLEKGGRLMGTPSIQATVRAPAQPETGLHGFTPLAISHNVDRLPEIDDRARGTRTTVANTRLDLGMARRQLQSNAFDHPFSPVDPIPPDTY